MHWQLVVGTCSIHLSHAARRIPVCIYISPFLKIFRPPLVSLLYICHFEKLFSIHFFQISIHGLSYMSRWGHPLDDGSPVWKVLMLPLHLSSYCNAFNYGTSLVSFSCPPLNFFQDTDVLSHSRIPNQNTVLQVWSDVCRPMSCRGFGMLLGQNVWMFFW